MNVELDDADVIYDVRPKFPGSHLYVVATRINAPDPDGQEFSLPAWIPGSYMIRDFARHVIAVNATANGEAVKLTKSDKSTWRAAPVNGSLLLEAEIYANDLSVRGAFLDRDHGFLNGVCLFFRIHGCDHEPCVVHIAPPEHATDWKVATGLTRLTGEEHEFGAFTAADYAELIDRPVLIGPLTIGQFELAGATHQIAMVGGHDIDMERIEQDVATVCASHVELFGGSVPFDRYVFLVTVLDSGYGGLEHANSTALVCSRQDLPVAGQQKISWGYRRFLGLVSHEYFHLWNVKRIRPAEFVAAAADREAYTRQLWVFEGITSYYDDLGLLRSGMIDVPAWLELLGQTLTGVYRAGGRRRQTLEESSFDAWIKFYKQDENSPNAIVSYYRKGAMTALALDLEMRLRTNGSVTLDSVMRALWRQYGQQGIGVPQDGVEQLVEQLSGQDFSDFFSQALRSTVDPPVGILLAQFGIRLHMRAAESDADAGGLAGKRESGPLPWLGFRTQSRGDRLLIGFVAAKGRAAEAGLSVNDELVSLDGNRVTPANWLEVLDRVNVGEPVEIVVMRRDELRQFSVEPGMPPRDTCYLSLETDVSADIARRRREWLGA